ncbi:gas vesicle protein GvpH [Desulfocucumis palustris]|uniref:Gas vesicle protein GvpH n=1 Tax=Desulfocucumis palustris TaxID=1898651 RepID=A0A2L2X8U2_9FIRM|nr:Hsp20/alpha crystallin family protein [Desulfocucumis palustris]GBF32440.1 gas vesicle protein GvpH [Desulfocucumis palustris]
MKKDFFDGLKLSDVVKGITDLVELAQRMEAEKKTEETKSGVFHFPRDKKIFQGSYGFNVRLGGLGDSPPPSFADKENPPKIIREKIARQSWEPVTDVFDEGESLQIVVEVPGARENSLGVAVSGGDLEIKIKQEGTDKVKSISLPCEVNPESLKYVVRNGILTITLDKAA